MTAEGTACGPGLMAWRAGLCLLGGVLGLSGCAQSPARSMARVWQEVPKIRWSTVPDTAPVQKAAEPNVAANTPSEAAETVAALPPERPSGQLRDSLRTGRKSAIAPENLAMAQRHRSGAPQDPFLELDDAAQSDGVEQQPSSESVADVGELQFVSARDRLRAALSDDSRRVETPEEFAGEQERLRLRIESLMNRARIYLAEQQLVAAKRAAGLAQTLAESSGLEFAPEEERPVDLLTSINGRLEAEQALAQAEEVQPEAEEPGVKSEAALEGNSVENVARTSSSPREKRSTFDRSLPFDPYEPHLASKQDGDADAPALGTSLVVLESPSFDDEEEEVSPIGFTRESDATSESANMAKLRMTRFRRTERVPEPATADSDSDAEPASQLELPQMPAEIETVSEAAERATAPPPPISEPRGPTLELGEAMELPADDDDEAADSGELLDDSDSEGAALARPRQAIIWPRWLSLALASLLTTALCGWFWRRRALAER